MNNKGDNCNSIIELTVSGLSQGKKPGTYTLLLAERNGKRRMPILIGQYEAQAIAACLQNVTPVRPLTHDLFTMYGKAFGIVVTRVDIYKIEQGIFYSYLHCQQGSMSVNIDARTSDAVAIALRYNCPIFTTEDIIHEVASKVTIVFPDGKILPPDIPIEEMTPEQLAAAMDNAIADENYELASQIRDLINRRNA